MVFSFQVLTTEREELLWGVIPRCLPVQMIARFLRGWNRKEFFKPLCRFGIFLPPDKGPRRLEEGLAALGRDHVGAIPDGQRVLPPPFATVECPSEYAVSLAEL